MRVALKYIFFVLGFFSIPLFLNAQVVEEKMERERKIKPEQLPKDILELIEPLINEGRSTKYYEEYTEEAAYYEIKTIYQKEKFSVKFQKNGRILDIEILKSFEELPELIQKDTEQYFEAKFKKFQFRKIQTQYTASAYLADHKPERKYDLHFLQKVLQKDFVGLTVKYEIEAEVITKEKKRRFYEFLFNSSGQVEKIQEIVQRSNDNVLY